MVKKHIFFGTCTTTTTTGGELFTYLRDAWKFPETTAKFYAGSVSLGFEHMHSKDIIYRDLNQKIYY